MKTAYRAVPTSQTDVWNRYGFRGAHPFISSSRPAFCLCGGTWLANVHYPYNQENKTAMPRIVQFQHVAPSKQDPDGGFFALTSDGRIYSVTQNRANGQFLWQEIKTPDLGPDPAPDKEVLGTLAVAEFALANCAETVRPNSIQNAALTALRRVLRDLNAGSTQPRVNGAGATPGPEPVPMSKEHTDKILAGKG